MYEYIVQVQHTLTKACFHIYSRAVGYLMYCCNQESFRDFVHTTTLRRNAWSHSSAVMPGHARSYQVMPGHARSMNSVFSWKLSQWFQLLVSV